MRRITPPSEWPADAFERLVGALDQAASAPVGPHFAADQIDGLIDGTIDETAAQPLWYHLSSCEECAIAVEKRLEEVRSPRLRLIKTRRPKTPATVQPQLQFQPYYPTDHPPGCVSPLKRASEEKWTNIVIRPPKDRPLSAPTFPRPRIDNNVCPLVVTTAFRAAFEHRRGDAWRVVAPLVLAPPITRIVTTRKSGLGGLADDDLAKALKGRCIAVADITSTFSARLVAAARHYKTTAKHVTQRPDTSHLETSAQEVRTLYLTTRDFADMVPALMSGEIDGFATVEPFPTIAKQLLRGQYAEATLGPDSASPPSQFCCVVLGPRALVEDERFRLQYEELVQSIFRSLWRVLADLRLDVRQPEAGGAVHGDLGRLAAASMFRHIIDELDTRTKTDAQLEEKLVTLLVPEMTKKTLNAEYEALNQFLSDEEFRRLEMGKAPGPLYTTKTLRALCAQAIRLEQGSESLKEDLLAIERAWNDGSFMSV